MHEHQEDLKIKSIYDYIYPKIYLELLNEFSKRPIVDIEIGK